jgi:beta-phosphoglucomutase-like phosphatase (HAD superfamily)
MTEPGSVRAVIFDFDGVLADTERLHLAAFRRVFAARGWDLDEAAYFNRYLGYDDAGLIEAYAADHGIRLSQGQFEELLDEKSGAFRRDLDGQLLYPGAIECVSRLSGCFTLGIASGALRSEIETILSAAGVLARFGAVVGADDVRATKPAPEPYLTAASRLGVDPSRCVAVEDSRWGIESARGAGMRAIGITTTSPAAALAGAHRIVSHLDEVTVAAIEQLADR